MLRGARRWCAGAAACWRPAISVEIVIGLALIATGVLVLTGFDKRLEALLVEALPMWLTDLTTRL